MNQQRPTLGEKLLARLEERLRRRPRIGFSPGFYARFGLEDPWLMDSFGGDPLQQEESFRHLSGGAFYAHLARLGRKRWWRDRRQKTRLEKLAGLTTASRVRYPGDGLEGLAGRAPSSALATLALDFHLPSPVGAETPEQSEETLEPSLAWYRGRDFVPARVSRKAWHSVDHPGARVVRGSKRQLASEAVLPRAMDRAGERIHRAGVSQDPLVRDLESVSGLLSSVKRKRVARVLSRTEHLPAEERIVLLRRVLGSGAGARIVRFQVERNLADSKTASLDRALGRRTASQKGLRPVLRTAPSVDWSLPDPLSTGAVAPVELEETTVSPSVRRVERRLGASALSASPVQIEQGSAAAPRPGRRRRQTEAVLGRLDAALAREIAPAAVASSIVQRTPGRFEPVSPVEQAAHIAPLGRTPSESGNLDAPEGVVEPGLRTRATREERQPEAAALEPVVVHKTPLSPKARPTRWAVARLDAPAVSVDFASKAPLLSSLPLPLLREADETERFLSVDLRREDVAKLGIRRLETTVPEMALLEDSSSDLTESQEESLSPGRPYSASVSSQQERRPSWDRGELKEPPPVLPEDPKPLWPRSAPERPGFRAVADDTPAATTDHAWFRTPGGVRVRSKGYRTPDGVWVSSPSYRTPQRQKVLQGLRFEPVFPAFFEEEESVEQDTSVDARPAVRVARRAGWEPAKTRQGILTRTPSMDLSQNLRLLSEGQADSHAPAWTDRAVGGPKIRASSELIRHLVQASDPEEVIRLIVDKGQDLTRESALPSPVVEVIKQIKGEASKVESEPVQSGSSAGARVFSGGQRPSRAARRISGFRPLRGPGATRTSAVGEDRVMKLAGKLRSLIHLAEVENRRDEARKHARLSADEAPQVEAPGTAEEQEGAGQADVQALIQEIVSAVNREMDLRRERRQEDNHEPWW